jgi:hypothetical protein
MLHLAVRGGEDKDEDDDDENEKRNVRKNGNVNRKESELSSRESEQGSVIILIRGLEGSDVAGTGSSRLDEI